MAMKQWLTLEGDRSPCFNINYTVGVGGINHIDDLILIQAMFRFIAKGFGELSTLGLTSINELPRLTGILDRNTISTIRSYQRRWTRLLLNVDGLIHPADYIARDLKLDPTTRRMAMTLLHQHAQDAGFRLGETDYTTAMVRMFPELRGFVRPLW
jgi:hypothetical protein